MTSKKQFLKGGAVLSGSQVVGQLCSLGRNVIIARMVTPADFGVAAIFVMVVAFLEMVSNLSLDRLLVQANDGDDAVFQEVAQFLQACRGTIIFFILLISAGFIAELFSVPEAKGSFVVLAFIPLINGFCHLDPKRIEREMCFWPGASVELASQVVVLMLAWPVGEWYGDYRAMLALLIVKVVIMFLGSQIVADRKYRWSLDRGYIKRFATFGWPLLVNGLLLFGILQGDRFIMGSAQKMFGSNFSMADVGFYSAAFTLTMIPAMMCNKISAALFLPLLAKVRDCQKEFLTLSQDFGDGLTVIASLFGVVLILLGDKILPYIYGGQYLVAGRLVGWLSIMWSVRLLRVLPASIALAQGLTKNLMVTNVVRILSLIGVLFVVICEMDIVWIAILGAVGELLAYCCALYLNKRRLDIPYRIHSKSVVLLILCLGGASILKGVFFVGAINIPWLTFCMIIVGYIMALFLFYRTNVQRLVGM